MTVSTSALLVRKPIQYELVPAKYCFLPSMMKEVPLVVEMDPDGATEGEMVPAADDVVVVAWLVVLLVVAGVVLGLGLTEVVVGALEVLYARVSLSQGGMLPLRVPTFVPVQTSQRRARTGSTTPSRHCSGSRKRRS